MIDLSKLVRVSELSSATNVNCVSALACYTRLRSLNLKGPTDLRMYTVRARYTLRTQQILTPVILGVIRSP